MNTVALRVKVSVLQRKLRLLNEAVIELMANPDATPDQILEARDVVARVASRIREINKRLDKTHEPMLGRAKLRLVSSLDKE